MSFDEMDDDEQSKVGIIESVHVKNFMCHTNYRIEFGPYVNTVLGRNGSGKSSLLVAIQIALGGKASYSGKSLVLKNTVQRGKSCSEVAVTLRNSGPDAFEPDKYGSQITIERKISDDGISSYKLKGSKGNVVSTKKDSLNALLTAFNIQVNNPVAILTQEMSKVFLNSKDSRDKYMLFLKATQLEQLQNVYSLNDQQVKHVETILECKKQSLKPLKSTYLSEERKVHNYESIADKRDLRDQLLRELAWSIVQEKEEATKESKERYKKRQNETEKAENKLREIQRSYDATVEKGRETTDLVNQLQEELNSLNARGKQLWDQIRVIQINEREKQNSLTICEREIMNANKGIDILESRAADAKKWSEENLQEQKTERCNTIMAHGASVAADEQKLRAEEQKLYSLRQDYANKCEELAREKLHYNEVSFKIIDIEKDIDKLQAVKSNHILAYNSRTPALLRLIKQHVDQGYFQQPPIGPLGLYINVKERKWALAVEQCLGVPLISSFLCDNFDDQEKLLELMKQVYGNQPTPAVTSSRFIQNVHNVDKVRSNHICLMDMLEVSNPIVMNTLIDQRQIERLILIPVAADARDIMMNNPPPKCKSAFTVKGNSVYPYPTYRFYSSRKKTARFINASGNVDESIIIKTKECSALRNSSRKIQERMQGLHYTINFLLQNTIKKLEASVIAYNTRINAKKAEIQDLEDAEEPDLARGFEADLSELRSSMQSKLEQKTVLEQEITVLKEQFKIIETEANSNKRKLFERNAELEAAMRKRTTCSNNIVRLAKARDVWQERYDNCMKQLKAAEDKYLKELSNVHEDIEVAKGFCDRVNTTRKPSAVQAAIAEVEAHIKEVEDNYPDMEAIYESYAEHKKKYENLLSEIKCLEDAGKKMKKMLIKRREQFEHTRYFMCVRINSLFVASLHRNYSGKLVFDHENQTLDIKARACMGKDKKVATRSLSGGEKSFVTVALLLALWDAVELPFRIMDEYDVYMDQVNRKKSMDLMIKTALSHSGNQFIFFSPQPLTKMKSSTKINILQLPEPERKKPQKRKRSS